MLSTKQKKYLKSEAHHLKAIFQIGKDGLSYNQITSISDALEAHELIKIKLLETCPIDTHTAAIEITAQTKSEVVQIIGHTLVLFKQSEKRIYAL